jgi:hypothetical protein
MKAPHVNVTIDRLVLRGFAPEQRDAIAAGLHAELRRQLSDPTISAEFTANRSIASVRAAPITVGTALKPGRIGSRAAQRMVRSIGS